MLYAVFTARYSQSPVDKLVECCALLGGADGAHDGHVLQGGLRLIDRGEVAAHPQGQFVGGDVELAFHRFRLVLGEAREQQSSCGEARFVHAIKVQGRVFRHDADADDGLRADSFLSKPACLLPMGIIFEAPGSVPIARGDHRPFAIAEFPIQVSSEEHVPLGVGES